MFVSILRARQRTQNTHKHVEKDELRRSRNVYERIAPTVSAMDGSAMYQTDDFQRVQREAQNVYWKLSPK